MAPVVSKMSSLVVSETMVCVFCVYIWGREESNKVQNAHIHNRNIHTLLNLHVYHTHTIMAFFFIGTTIENGPVTNNVELNINGAFSFQGMSPTNFISDALTIVGDVSCNTATVGG